MYKQKSLVFNYIMNVILVMSSVVFPLITFPYVSRILSPGGTGKISFATSVVSYFVMFSQLGIPTYGICVCAQVRNDKKELSRRAHELVFINFIMSICSYIMLFIIVLHSPKLNQEKNLIFIISMTIVFNMIGMEWLYKALEQYAYIAIRSIVFKCIAIVAMFVFVRKQEDYIYYGAITIFASSASSIFNFINVHKLIITKFLGEYNIKRHIRPVIVFFAMSCATIIYTNLDAVMLGFMKSDIDVGYYNAAIKVKTILVSVVTSLGTVLLPRISYYIQNKYYDEFQRVATKAINFTFIVAFPICVYFMLFANESILSLSGEAYAGAVFPMKIIMPTLVFIGLTNVMGIQMLIPMGKEKYVLYSEIAGAVVDLFFNIILIPILAASGAAWGTLAAEIVVWVVQFNFLKEEVKHIYCKIRYKLLITAVLLSILVSYWIKWIGQNAFQILFISAILYFGCYILFLYIMKEPLVMEVKSRMIHYMIKKFSFLLK